MCYAQTFISFYGCVHLIIALSKVSFNDKQIQSGLSESRKSTYGQSFDNYGPGYRRPLGAVPPVFGSIHSNEDQYSNQVSYGGPPKGFANFQKHFQQQPYKSQKYTHQPYKTNNHR